METMFGIFLFVYLFYKITFNFKIRSEGENDLTKKRSAIKIKKVKMHKEKK